MFGSLQIKRRKSKSRGVPEVSVDSKHEPEAYESVPEEPEPLPEESEGAAPANRADKPRFDYPVEFKTSRFIGELELEESTAEGLGEVIGALRSAEATVFFSTNSVRTSKIIFGANNFAHVFSAFANLPQGASWTLTPSN